MSFLGAELMLPTRYHFCTYFDRNYLTRGLVLYRSLVHHCQHPFTLWILCFDAVTYQTLDRFHLPGVNPIALEQFKASDPDLQKAKTNRSLGEYSWTCTPSLPFYILNQLPEVDLIVQHNKITTPCTYYRLFLQLQLAEIKVSRIIRN
jgi:hypothetical protein